MKILDGGPSFRSQKVIESVCLWLLLKLDFTLPRWQENEVRLSLRKVHGARRHLPVLGFKPLNQLIVRYEYFLCRCLPHHYLHMLIFCFLRLHFLYLIQRWGLGFGFGLHRFLLMLAHDLPHLFQFELFLVYDAPLVLEISR